jgi:hypothetical protein
MSNGVIAFLVAIGSSAWIYSKLMRRTGNNSSSSIITAAISGVFIFVVALFLLGFVTGIGK